MALTQAELLKSESIDDRVNSLFVAGAGINLTYDDNANTLTIAGAGNLDYGLIAETAQVIVALWSEYHLAPDQLQRQNQA